MAKVNKKEQELLDRLAELGGQRTQDDALIYEGTKFILPLAYEGKSMDRAIGFLKTWAEQRAEKIQVERTFSYHPYDVANAFQRVLKTIFGTTGIVQRQDFEFFGMKFEGPPPEMKTVRTSATSTIQVPWGRVELPPLEAEFFLDFGRSRNKQVIGRIVAVLPKRFRGHAEGVFKAVEEDLKVHSIYRGKAIDANWLDPDFLAPETVQEDKVAYSADTRTQLKANIWSVLEHSDAIKALGMSLKRAVLLEGPYGCGKSLTGMLTAQKALRNGWSFIYCRPGQNLEQALHAAKLLAPSVVFFEDLDVVADPSDGEVITTAGTISQLLDMFDGVANKNTPIVAVLTTNHVERIHKGMLRPGRLDAVVHIGALDAEGVQTLVQSVLPEDIRGSIDYTALADEMDGFLPAFIKEATERALRYSLARGEGQVEPVSTEDLVASAASLRPQLELMEGANERPEPEPLARAFGNVVYSQIQGSTVRSEDEGWEASITLPAGANGNSR